MFSRKKTSLLAALAACSAALTSIAEAQTLLFNDGAAHTLPTGSLYSGIAPLSPSNNVIQVGTDALGLGTATPVDSTSVTATDMTITATDVNAFFVVGGATATLNNPTLIAHGNGGRGAISDCRCGYPGPWPLTPTTHLTINGGTITSEATALYASRGGELALNNVSIATSGSNAGAYGISTGQNATIIIKGGSITTNSTAPNALGIEVWAPSTIVDLRGPETTTIATNSPSGYGFLIFQDGKAYLENDVVRTQGPASHAFAATDTANGSTGTVDITGGTVTTTAADSDGFYIANSNQLDIDIRGGATITAGSKTLLNVQTGSVATFDADASQLNGAILTDGTSTSAITLTGAGNLWNVQGNSSMTTLINSGRIVVEAPVANVFKTIATTGNYTSNAGSLTLNTALGNNASPTDVLTIGGDTSGTTTLTINNAAGLGNATTGDGILVVSVTGNSTGVFTLAGGSVQAGNYVYTLHQGASPATTKNWYLTSFFAPPPAAAPVPLLPPFSMALLGLGLLGAAYCLRYRKTRS